MLPRHFAACHLAATEGWSRIGATDVLAQLIDPLNREQGEPRLTRPGPRTCRADLPSPGSSHQPALSDRYCPSGFTSINAVTVALSYLAAGVVKHERFLSRPWDNASTAVGGRAAR